MDIRSRIKETLDAKPDLSPRSVSLSAGLSDSMVHKFMTGATKSMTVDNLEKIAGALGVSARWLIFGDGSREVSPQLVYIWDHIPAARRDQALKVLEAFVEDETPPQSRAM